MCTCTLTAEGHGAPFLSRLSLGHPVGVDRLDGEQTLPPLPTRPPLSRVLIGWWAGRTRLLQLVFFAFFFCGVTELLQPLGQRLRAGLGDGASPGADVGAAEGLGLGLGPVGLRVPAVHQVLRVVGTGAGLGGRGAA